MAAEGRSTARKILGFVWRSTAAHVVTYVVIGALSYWLIAKRYWTGPDALPGLRDPSGEFVQRWFIPAQLLRGMLHGLVLYPLLDALLAMRRWGGAVLASILLVIGSLAGISGLIEGLVYSTTASVRLYLAHLPEIIIQTLLYGYWLLAWERKARARRA